VALGLAGLQRLRAALDVTRVKNDRQFRAEMESVLSGDPVAAGFWNRRRLVLRRSRLFPRTSRCPLQQGSLALASRNVLIFNAVKASFWQGNVVLASM
jgi:hypothetical protein